MVDELIEYPGMAPPAGVEPTAYRFRRRWLYPLSYGGVTVANAILVKFSQIGAKAPLNAGREPVESFLVERKGIEPSTFALRTRRSPI